MLALGKNMNFARIGTIFLMIMVVSCKPQKASKESMAVEVSSPEVVVPEYDEVWMMQGWYGYMGVLIALRDNEYDYWFYSDVNFSPMEEPDTGIYRRDEDGITLRFLETSSDIHMYSTDWRFVKDGDEVKLAAIDDLNAGRDSGRWLRKVNVKAFRKYYDPKNPFLLSSNRHLELEFEDENQETQQDGDPDS